MNYQYSKFVLCVLVFLSCQADKQESVPIEQTASMLIARSLNRNPFLLSPQELNDAFFAREGVPPKFRSKFMEIYNRLRMDIAKVPSNYSESIPVRFFLLNMYLTQNQDGKADTNYDKISVRFIASPDNNLFMAFALLSENFLDPQYIGNDTYIKSLARSFNVRPSQIYNGIWVC